MNERATQDKDEKDEDDVSPSIDKSNDNGSGSCDNTKHRCLDISYYWDGLAVEAQAREEEARARAYSCYVERHNAAYMAVEAEARFLEAEVRANEKYLHRIERHHRNHNDEGKAAICEAEHVEEDARRSEIDTIEQSLLLMLEMIRKARCETKIVRRPEEVILRLEEDLCRLKEKMMKEAEQLAEMFIGDVEGDATCGQEETGPFEEPANQKKKAPSKRTAELGGTQAPTKHEKAAKPKKPTK